MKLFTLRATGSTGAYVGGDGGLYPVATDDGQPYGDVGALLAHGEQGLKHARAALAGEPVVIEQARIARPILEPGAVICVGLNYRQHILEMKRELPKVPTLFSKLSRALTDPYADIVAPTYSEQLDYEGELGVVIGKGGRDITAADAWDAVAGLTVINDVTLRDWQWRTAQWFAGKTGQSLSPLGPAVVTIDEFPDGIGNLELSLSVNGEVRQRASLGDLVFDVPALVSDISRVVELRPGDVIATGTPGGVGAAMDPPRWLAAGDTVEVHIEGVGALRNVIRAPSKT